MKHIFEYIKEERDEIAYISRSISGCWSISLKRKRNISNRTISSYQKLSDSEVKTIRDMGILIYDFKGKDVESHLSEFNAMCETSKMFC